MDPVIVENIKSTLKTLEQEQGIHLLVAVESGSRSWGFPSPDSDYDCRFVYVKPLEEYLTIEEPVDHIHLPVDVVYDIAGWDLKKLLMHLKKSNPTVWEWLQSAVVYGEDEAFRQECLELAKLYFNEKSAIYHYKSLAYKKLEEIKVQEVGKLKAYFYALRSTLCCEYMMKHHTIPPITLQALIEGVALDESLEKEINRLVELKLTVDESYQIVKHQQIIVYIEEALNRCNSYLEEKNKGAIKKETTAINECFRKWVRRLSE